MTELGISIGDSDWACDDPERELIAQAKRDPKAFAMLYRRHYGAIAGYVQRRVGDSNVTDDLVAEVFLAAMRSLRRYGHRGTFRAWLYRIATNVVNRWARRHQRRAKLELRVFMANQRQAEEGSVMGSDGVEHARRALLSLSPKHQTVLALHYLEGLSVEGVAEVVGCGTGTVKSRLSRGREALRQRLEQER